jgi:hypothetical protein
LHNDFSPTQGHAAIQNVYFDMPEFTGLAYCSRTGTGS